MFRSVKNSGDVLALANVLTAVFTVIIGIIYVYYKPPKADLHWTQCGWENPSKYTLWVDCNQAWASAFGLSNFPSWTPLFTGVPGVFMMNPMMLQVVGFPRNFLQWGIYLVVKAFMGDFGFCGKLGVANGWISCALAVASFGAAAAGIRDTRMLEFEDGSGDFDSGKQ
eukprot:TRINITY_DN6535_c0_g1_i1.p1 TRINITY_DN6535_c0_g1~~TRINITY_DN6535_c0_g1_i1.p1  ORF type:complete len:168 (-),score=32.53 TRINITY_DN6535_c0_g1_i1:125-628(-)